MTKKLIYLVMVVLFVSTACSLISINSSKVIHGSGIPARETRPVDSFTSVELAGSGEVTITFGDSESVDVEADDNILPVVVTRVRDGKLVITIQPNTNVTPEYGIHVRVTMKSLESASISGSGSIVMGGLEGESVRFDITGSGTISAQGAVKTVNIGMGGSGNILCGELQAQSAGVKLTGSGNVMVHASEELDATVSGSGNVQYRGNPANVQTSITGSGNIDPIP